MAGTRGTKAATLGAQMREARRQYLPDSTARSMCDLLGVKHPTVSRWETGERSPRPEDVAAYLTAVGTPAELREQLVEMPRDTSRKPWLTMSVGRNQNDQGQYAAMLEIERTAKDLIHVAPLLVPGLLQTPEYARALYLEGGVLPDLVDTRVAVRIGRQAALIRRDPLSLRAFIWEPVLHSLLGGEQVMTDQLAHLLEAGQRDNIDVRIIPTRARWNPGWEGPFSVATFPEAVEREPVVQLENKVSALYLDAADEVAPYLAAGVRAEKVAMSSEASAELIANVIDGKEKAS
ncbi:helix-turn-helix transcriptional regulator [Amycolatopsis rhabdoformis]|uniref:Helix-turn-helix transcriptional regulator n=1 Tax=Amycolatopsis rhabdoformis TaxID=1448059 RepID=A0ABZ1HU96_9PSEU|nr:helix-turn-helix transcriptional regulator [Amycolatopsis rhabdoformis]WSE25992.1 helix-turn-helix transcriptional regulator [Amycolatopsis rhabdoformis]